MYISSTGSVLSEDKFIMADNILLNMTLDINDIPMSYYGIVTNINKDNYIDTLLELKLMILNWIQYSKLTDLKLDNVVYENNTFIALFDYKNTKLSMKIQST